MTSEQSLIVGTASVSRAAAVALIHAALNAVAEGGYEASIAIVDNGGALKAFSRGDGVPYLPGEIAINKAWTAAGFGWPTHVWNAYLADPKLAPLANHPKVTPVAGGYPLLLGGKLVGGIGIAGGNYEQDREAALAALQAAGFEAPAG